MQIYVKLYSHYDMHLNRNTLFICFLIFPLLLLIPISGVADSTPQILQILDLGGITQRPPLIDGGILYTGTMDSQGLAFDLSSGKKIWSKGFKAAVTTTPVKFGLLVILATDIGDGRIYALNAQDLKKVWNKKLYGGSSTPLVLGQSLIIPQDKRIICLDGASGAKEWEIKLNGAIKSSGVIAEGEIFLGGDDGILYILANSGEILSQTKMGSALLSDLSYANGVLAVGDYGGTIHIMQVSDNRILWEQKLPAPILSKAIFYDDLIICNSLDGTWRGFNSANGDLIWEYKCPALVRGNWSIWNDYLVFGAGDGYLYALEPRTGLFCWKSDIHSRALWGCSVDHDRIYIPTAEKQIVILGYY